MKESSDLHPSYSPKCTHAYAVSARGARRLIQLLTYRPFAFSRALDQALVHLIKRGLLRAFSVVPAIAAQRRCHFDLSHVIETEEIHDFHCKEGDSDIRVDEHGKGHSSSWRDELVDSALDRLFRNIAMSST